MWAFAKMTGRFQQHATHMTIGLRSSSRAIGGHIQAHLQPQAKMIGSMFLAGKTKKTTLKNVRNGHGFLHLNIPDSARQQLLHRMGNGPGDGRSRESLNRMLNAINGDYTITTDGSLLNAVMAIGVKSKASASAFMDGLLDILAQVGCDRDSCSKISPSKSVAGGKILSLSFRPSGTDRVRLDFHHAYANGELVIALSPADLRRRLDPKWTTHGPIKVRPGTLFHGNLGNPFMLMNATWMREIMNLGIAHDFSTIIGAKMTDFGESQVSLSFEDKVLKGDIQISRLPKGGPDAKLYQESVTASLLGDNLKANIGWHQLAAQFPNTPHGHAGKNRSASLGPIGPAIVGVMSAVAIPAFMKYIKRSKTSEATLNIQNLFDGAVAYAHTRADKDSPIVPESTPLTPGNPTQFMCKNGQSHKYQPTPATFEHPTWQALNFAITNPFFYAYQFESKNQGGKSMFTVRAVGDLDCDGILSTFERVGYMDELGNISGGTGLVTKDELE